MRTVKLGEFMVSRAGTLNPADFPEEEFELYSIPAHDRGGPEMVLGGSIGSAKQVVQPGDVMISKIIPHIRRARIVKSMSGRRQVASGEWIVLRGREFAPEYLRLFLVSDGFHAEFMNTVAGVGGSLVRARPQFVKAIDLPLPPLPEQRRIAAILDHADALRTQRRHSLSLLDGLGSSLFLDMFGDPVSNLDGWPLRPITDIGTLERGVSKHRPRNDPRLLGGPHPLIQTGDVAGSRGSIVSHTATYSDLGLAQSRLWPAGTLCITIAANIAKTGILQFDACFPDSVVGFSSTPEWTRFVQGWLAFLQPQLEASAPQSAQKNINLAVLRSLAVPVPPVALVRDYADRLAAIDSQRAAAQRSLDSLDELFASLQARAFSGRL